MKKQTFYGYFLLFLFFTVIIHEADAQPPRAITYSFNNRSRDQDIKQYTNIFVSSPVANQMLGAVTGPFQSGPGVNTNRYFEYVNGAYQLITVLNAATTPMVPGRGYVIQRGGFGPPPLGDGSGQRCIQSYNSGGATNTTNIPVQINGGMYNLIGNPYLGYLDVDAFLLDPANAGLVTGPLLLWGHSTIASSSNPQVQNNPDNSTYRFSSNDFALYNVLGGVASGRQISTSPENGTYTGVVTPNGKLGFGTGFMIRGLSSGNAVFRPSMSSSTDDGGDVDGQQSFRGVVVNTATREKGVNPEPTTNTTPGTLALPTKNRIWVNIEEGEIPTIGSNLNQLKQLLVGYADGATMGDSDRVYDAETVTLQSRIEFYSLAPAFTGSTKHLAIQGRGNSDFSGTDYFQLGYRVATGGNYTFTAKGDGIFTQGSGKPYFLWDNGVLHELPYTTNISATAVGVFNETRFRIVFRQKTLSIKLNIEGYYDTNTHLMRPVKLNQGTSGNSTIVDDLVVELWDTSNNLVHSESTVLYTNGYTGISFPSLAAGSYYVVVKHRNAIQTWSANPVDVGNILVYDFTTADIQAYGSNQIEVEPGVFAFYSGDINQDESVDNLDSDSLYDDIVNSNFGNLATDLDGDGAVDNIDIEYYYNNLLNFIFSMHP